MDIRYCPVCAGELIEAADEDGDQRLRRRCAEGHWTHWNNPLPVVAALVEWRGKILLARNANWPEGTFALITGFLEQGETPEQGVARELKEETGLDASETTLIGVYEFIRKNEVLIVYHVRAEGEVCLSPELLEYRLYDLTELRPWRAGTGLAMADWMRRNGIEPEFKDWPA